MPNDPFFWLHIKKSAGSRIRTLLQPHYVEVDRAQKPITFIQANPEQYNDILNNYRVVLGDHQFKRCLFAKKYLYPHNWDNIYSFAFSREPVDRCVSMFHYLYWRKPHVAEIPRALNKLMRGRTRKLELNASFAFDGTGIRDSILNLTSGAGNSGTNRSVYCPRSSKMEFTL
ncbi:sulfotransferase family 2 domain-containing protein [Salinisphaera sp. USBA-960]|nr:sulfotransferase family 2 domain-containing protein [Salifodinibacter halophilus]NNC26580.1 sulfotransferase family 2 domain-containing protein [Salifodinibacter halophilus]